MNYSSIQSIHTTMFKTNNGELAAQFLNKALENGTPKGEFIPNTPEMQKFEQAFEMWIDSFSGASGAVVANLLFYPLENFRTRIQAMQGQ